MILSPVTGSDPTTKEMELPVSRIIERYREIGMDVSRYFIGINSVEIRKCSRTGYRFYYPFTIFGDDKFYGELQTKYPEYYAERWEHNTALGLLHPGQNVLEVGSGSGYFLNLMAKKSIRSTGIELNEKAIEEGKKNGLEIKNMMLGELAGKQIETFDAICSFQVLEHIQDVRSYFLDSLKALKHGGQIIIGVPHNNPFIFKTDIFHTLNLPPHHAGLWNKESFEALSSVFPIRLKHIFIEPLHEYKDWYKAQMKHNLEHHNLTGKLMRLVPRPVYKLLLKAFRNRIEGRNIVAVFEKI